MAVTNNTNTSFNNKELSIQLSLSGLSFCILNTNNSTVETLFTTTYNKKNPTTVLDTVVDVFNTQKELQQSFDKITVIHENEWSTLVPKPLFDKEHIADYLKFNTKILKTDFITFDDISQNESINVYVPFTNINNYLFDKFGSFTYKHYSTILIEHILTQEKHNKSPKVYANINANTFEIVVVTNGKLVLYNTFNYQSKEDFIYYTLFVYEQLQLNPDVIEIVFLGEIDKSSPLYTIAYNYIRHVGFGNRFDNFQFKNPIENLHSNFTLLKSLQCE